MGDALWASKTYNMTPFGRHNLHKKLTLSHVGRYLLRGGPSFSGQEAGRRSHVKDYPR